MQVDAITHCIQYQGPPDNHAVIVCPTLTSAKAIHWPKLERLLKDSKFVEDINRTDRCITFHNKLRLYLKGADREGDRIRGLNLFYAGLDEMQDIPEPVYTAGIFPALRVPGWRVLAIGTPKGKNNFFYKFCKQAYRTATHRYFHYTTEDNPLREPGLVENARLTLPPRIFRQEFEASWEELEGAIFPEFSSHNVVHSIPPFERVKAFYLTVDHGDVNPFLAVVALTESKRFYVVDAWSNPHKNQPVAFETFIHQAERLCDKHNIFRCYAPDDRPGAIESLRRRPHRALKTTYAVPRSKPGPLERYQMMDSLFFQKRLFILSQLKDMTNDISSFHRDKDKLGNIIDTPAPNQQDHSIDAVSYFTSWMEFYLNGDTLRSA